jgi:hypothetical protein
MKVIRHTIEINLIRMRIAFIIILPSQEELLLVLLGRQH